MKKDEENMGHILNELLNRGDTDTHTNSYNMWQEMSYLFLSLEGIDLHFPS